MSVCAVEILDMRVAGTPRSFAFDNRELLYRVAVRFRGASTFLTLRSDASSRALAVLGRHFSHYRPRLGRVRLERDEGRVRVQCATRDGTGDAVLDADTEREAQEKTSVFHDHTAATDFLLGMRFSADAVKGRVRMGYSYHLAFFASPTSSDSSSGRSASSSPTVDRFRRCWARSPFPSLRCNSHPVHAARASIAIDAPPETVFALITSGNLTVAPRWPWFLRIGLPMPERMNVRERGPGGSIRFDFAQGAAFARITAWEPPHQLAYLVERYVVQDLPFHITRVGRSPDYGFRAERVEDWLTLEDTRFVLKPTPDGGTLLERRVVWRRHLSPDLYFGWLQQTVIERGQVRLLELIAERAEAFRAELHAQEATALLGAAERGSQ